MEEKMTKSAESTDLSAALRKFQAKRLDSLEGDAEWEGQMDAQDAKKVQVLKKQQPEEYKKVKRKYYKPRPRLCKICGNDAGGHWFRHWQTHHPNRFDFGEIKTREEAEVKDFVLKKGGFQANVPLPSNHKAIVFNTRKAVKQGLLTEQEAYDYSEDPYLGEELSF